MKYKTFKMGGVHPDDHKISRDVAIERFPIPGKVAISMAQHLGAPATPCVEKGDKVVVGQVIGTPNGFVSGFVHSSVSGTVTAVEPRADIVGNMVMHVCIDVEGDDYQEGIFTSDRIEREIKGSPEELKYYEIKGVGDLETNASALSSIKWREQTVDIEYQYYVLEAKKVGVTSYSGKIVRYSEDRKFARFISETALEEKQNIMLRKDEECIYAKVIRKDEEGLVICFTSMSQVVAT